MSVVADASVVVKALAAEPGSDQAAELLRRHSVVAPDLLVAECLNALRKKVLAGVLTPEGAALMAEVLQRAPITFEFSQPLAGRALELSLRLSHPVYDCVYLAVAEKLGAVLITADDRLVERCRQPDAQEWGDSVRSLSDSLPPQVQERAHRPYMVRRARTRRAA